MGGVNYGKPWFVRGIYFNRGNGAGLFSLGDSCGSLFDVKSFRLWFVNLGYPIFGRGMRFNRGTETGVFSYAIEYGEANVTSSFRKWFVKFYL